MPFVVRRKADTSLVKKPIRRVKTKRTDVSGFPIYRGERHEYSNRGFFVFTVDAPLRKAAIAVSDSRLFDYFLVFAVLANILVIALRPPPSRAGGPLSPVLDAFDLAFEIIFTLEMLVKAMAFGFMLHWSSYLRRSMWNKLDFLIILLGWAAYFPALVDVGFVKLFRVVRALRLINKVKGMRRLVQTLFRALPLVLDIFIVFLFVMLLYGIVGVQLWQGRLRQKCFSPGGILNEEREELCSPNGPQFGSACDLGERCLQSPFNPSGVESFDNMAVSVLVWFGVMTFDDWVEVLYHVMDSWAQESWMFFVSFTFLATFCLLNLMVAMLASAFMTVQLSENEERREQLQAGTTEEEEVVELDAVDPTTMEMMPWKNDVSVENAEKRDSYVPVENAEKRDSSHESRLDTPVGTAKAPRRSVMFADGEPSKSVVDELQEESTSEHEETWQHPIPMLPRIVNSDAFTVVVLVFILEMLLKIIALTPMPYLKDPVNVFDGIIAILSVIELMIGTGSTLSVFRGFRLLRILRMIHHVSPLDPNLIYRSFKSVGYLSCLMFLIMFIYAVLGVQLFGGVYTTRPGRASFDTIGWAFLAVFQVFTGDAWVEMMADAYLVNKAAAVIYFPSLLVLCNFILVSLIVSALLEGLVEQPDHDAYDEAASLYSRLTTEANIRARERKRQGNCDPNPEWASNTVNRSASGKINDGGESGGEASADTVRPSHQVTGGRRAYLKRRRTWHRKEDMVAEDKSEKETKSSGDTLAVPNDSNDDVFSENDLKELAELLSLPVEEALPVEAALPVEEALPVEAALPGAFGSKEAVQGEAAANDAPPEAKDVKEAVAGEAEVVATAARKKRRLTLYQVAKRVTQNQKNFDQIATIPALAFVVEQAVKEEVQATTLDRILRPPVKSAAGRPAGVVLVGNSLMIFSKKNSVRVWLHKQVTKPQFDFYILVLILLNCVFLALDNPFVDPKSPLGQTIFYSDVVFTVLFALESAVQIIVAGLLFPKGVAYLTHWWNVLDFTIVLVSIMALFFGPAWKTFRAFRAVRALRVIVRNERARAIVYAFGGAVQQILNVLCVCFLVFLIFAILGVNLFKGSFWSCNDLSVAGEEECVGAYEVARCPEDAGAECFAIANQTTSFMLQRTWTNADAHFDHVGAAMVTLFQVATLEEWAQIMISGIDAVGPGKQPYPYHNPAASLFFVVFVVIGSFITLNLFIGVVISSFINLKNAAEGRHSGSPKEQEWIQVKLLLNHTTPKRSWVLPENPVRRLAYDIVSHPYFEPLILGWIIMNTAIMAIEHYNQDAGVTITLQILNIIFVAGFTVEAILKVVAYEFSSAVRDAWTLFDLVVVIMSLVGLFLAPGVGASVVRIFRVGRVLRMVKRAERLQRLFGTFVNSLQAMMHVAMLLATLLFIYCVVGVVLFGSVKTGGSGFPNHANFHTFPNALLSMYRMATLDGWGALMRGGSLSPPECSGNECGSFLAPVFFVSFLLLGSLIGMNLFIAVFMEGFADNAMASSDLLRHIATFRDKWSKYDPNATGRLGWSAAVNVLKETGAPFGIHGKHGRASWLAELDERRVPVGLNAQIIAFCGLRISLPLRWWEAKHGVDFGACLTALTYHFLIAEVVGRDSSVPFPKDTKIEDTLSGYVAMVIVQESWNRHRFLRLIRRRLATRNLDNRISELEEQLAASKREEKVTADENARLKNTIRALQLENESLRS